MMKGLIIIVTALTLFVLCEARPGIVTQRPVEREKSIKSGNYNVRIRRQNFDIQDYMDNFWHNVHRCAGCSSLNIGNGYKNRNRVHLGRGRQSHTRNYDMLNIGNGYKNKNKVIFGRKPISGNYGTVSIGNGSKNWNTVYFGARPRPGNKDPFTGSFWDDSKELPTYK